MGIFSRKKEIKRTADPAQEPQQPQWAYTPGGYSFNLGRYSDNPEALSTFFGGVELISNSIAEIPILIKNINDKQIIDNHPLITALKYGQLSKFNLIKQLIHDVYVNGNGIAYIERTGPDIKALTYCPPGSYTIFVNELTGKVLYQITLYGKNTITVDGSSVIHIFKNSKNGLTGCGIASYANITFPLSSATDRSALEFFDSGGNVSGILQAKRQLDTEEKIEARDAWNNAFRGKSKNGNVAILGNDFEYKQVGISQKDAQMIESREFNVLEICRYLNISPILLGVKAGSTYNNIEQAQLELVIHTLLPLIELIEEEFNKKLIKPSERGKIMIDFDEDKIMFSDKSSTANYYATLVKNGLISINEARIAMGYVEKEGCDDLIIPYTNINDNKVDTDNAEINKNNEEKDEE